MAGELVVSGLAVYNAPVSSPPSDCLLGSVWIYRQAKETK
jgi:hypothetical protein